MSEYISREAAIALTDQHCFESGYDAKWMETELRDLPSADVRPVVRGKWIVHKPFDSGRHNCNECIECSVCGTWFGHDCYEVSNFCPNCGAMMEES